MVPESTAAVRAATPRQALTAAMSGSFLEWYDFYLFGTAAGLIFPTLFFPNASPTAGVLESFGAFAAGFIMRPFEAILFGHFGDRFGRRRMLLITVSMMGGCTFLIGPLPTYNSIGAWAPGLLILLRLIQGVGIGGDFGGGALVALENAPTGRRGIMGSIHQVGTPVGLLAATGIFAIMHRLPGSSLNSWGWRIPFLLSAVFLFIAIYIRSSIPETRTFQSDRKTHERMPLLVLLLAVGTGCMFSLQGTLFAEMFRTPTRYTGIGVAYQVSALIGGAPTPAIATALAAAFGQSYWPVAIYLGAICAISLVCMILAGETFRNSLTRSKTAAEAAR